MGVFARDQDLFDAKLSVRAMAGILWIFCSNLHLSPDKSSLLLEVGHRVIRFLFQKFAECFVPLIDKLNGSLTVISFRSVGRAHGIVWLRYLAVVRRGSALVWIERLPYRISSVGQGGPISPQEMREAYRNLASLLDFETLKLPRFSGLCTFCLVSFMHSPALIAYLESHSTGPRLMLLLDERSWLALALLNQESHEHVISPLWDESSLSLFGRGICTLRAYLPLPAPGRYFALTTMSGSKSSYAIRLIIASYQAPAER
ncbi:hypothetical protein AK812_SmicGene45011 [Symbiodinium microadriaticum]|uniref:Uncharacterized protein n=1 Tax=Symbiodinium microadriaticum TaxID=2951 RepID=A0A1Q9BX39_SYMMI|nr:hypothetical protein AK812_SmicGene45011 [Symbiodinium microadriaticum]